MDPTCTGSPSPRSQLRRQRRRTRSFGCRCCSRIIGMFSSLASLLLVIRRSSAFSSSTHTLRFKNTIGKPSGRIRNSPVGGHSHQKHHFRPFSSLPVVTYKNADDDDDHPNQHKEADKILSLLEQQHKQQPSEKQVTVNGKNKFRVTAPYAPTGDQPAAIAQLIRQLEEGDRCSILQGITGTGKTFVMSHVIAAANRPTLVLCHNKTLAAQLARELRSFLSDNAVELFVSYYNHYVPEAYQETTGKYIGKKSSVNAEIDALRHRATRALLLRPDVVVVASVSCIYGLGLPSEYLDNSWALKVTMELDSWTAFVDKLESMLYTLSESDDEFERGQYQIIQQHDDHDDDDSNDDLKEQYQHATSKTIVLWPPHERFPIQIRLDPNPASCSKIGNSKDDNPYRVASIKLGRQTGLHPVASTHIFPARHHVISEERQEQACLAIEEELRERVQELTSEGKHLEAERLQQRTLNDLMMIRESGFCKGGENYSRHFAGRAAGEPPDTLMDYLGAGSAVIDADGSSSSGRAQSRDWLLLVDESHVTLSQLKAMYAGDQARKQRLVKHGYRLPSALDNRPLQASEFWDRVQQTVLVSATPGPQEQNMAEREPVEMVIRPTFVPDPVIHVRSSEGQLQDLNEEVKKRALLGQRTLAVALTKRDAEDLSSYLVENGTNATYIHSGLTTHERSDALKALQSGQVDCLVGVNLLREGLDLPQVSLVAVLSADCEGFLRSETSLLQTVGRCARNVDGTAIFYAKRVTRSMQRCIDATHRRRETQLAYNKEHQCEMRTTAGSSMMSIFDLSKDQIDAALEATGVGQENRKKLTVARDAVINPTFQSSLNLRLQSPAKLDVDHVPSSPGCYFWRDGDGSVLYIGKAKKLRSRVKSYLSRKAKHSPRIKLMLKKAQSVDFVLTPSERDALVLESNLIKHHQPPYNVLLKDDEHYPYICASLGERFPRLFVAPNKDHDGMSAKNQRYRYFGPYTSFKEINAILEGIEEKYGLRQLSFRARHGEASPEGYNKLFETVLDEVFGEEGEKTLQLASKRKEYEEAGLLFDSDFNKCRDVVVIGKASEQTRTILVHVSQLREGLVAGRFSYECKLPVGFGEEDVSDAVQTVLEQRHYPAGMDAVSTFSWFPDDILSSHELMDAKNLRKSILDACSGTERKQKRKITIGTAALSGPRQEVDARLLRFASENAEQEAIEKAMGSAKSLVDGTSAAELATMIGSGKAPSRIECYDVSHSQGEKAVASRVVFVDGRPVPQLYRKFNIKTVEGVDDYASLEEVLERRFRRLNDISSHEYGDGPWALPDLVLIDGGPGQLSAAIKGMKKAGVGISNGNEPVEESDFVDLSNAKENNASVAICSLAKREEKVFVPGGSNIPVNDAPDSPAALLLRALRDESHRFALKSHRSRRQLR